MSMTVLLLSNSYFKKFGKREKKIKLKKVHKKTLKENNFV